MQQKSAGTIADANINLHDKPVICGGSGTEKNIRSAAYPSMIPNAVHTCHCITRAPRIAGGVISATYIGTVADFGPMPNPRKKRAMNICHHVLTKPCQRQAMAEKQHVRSIVPLRPNQWLKGTVNQLPATAQQRYGAELTRPVSQASRCVSRPMPSCGL